jgi:hypothetical protein
MTAVGMTIRGRRAAAGGLWLIGLMLASGCSTSTERTVVNLIRSANDSNGKRIVNLYEMFQSARPDLRGPADEAAFRAFIADVNPDQLAAMGVSASDLDRLFVSDRDGAPFFIRYGLRRAPGGDGSQAIVIETKGVRDRHLVFMPGPKIIEAAPGEIEEYKTGTRDTRTAGGPPPPPKDFGSTR